MNRFALSALAAMALATPAISATYSNQASFLAANPGTTLVSFTGATSSLTHVPSGSTWQGVTFFGGNPAYVSTNFWGDHDSLLDDRFNGSLTLDFAAANSIGFYFATSYLNGTAATFTAFDGMTPVYFGILTGGGVRTHFSYFGVDGVGPITSITLDSTGTDGFPSVAEISLGANAVPEATSLALAALGFGLAGLAARRRAA